jgi:hypothetical protein
MSAAHHIPAEDSAEGTKYFFMAGSDKRQLNRISSNGALTPGLTAQGVTESQWEPFRQDLYKLPSLALSQCGGCGCSGPCFDSPGEVRNKWWTAMQELCTRHAQTFAPLGITLEPWVNLLKGRAMKFPGILLAYTAANAPAVVVSAGAVPAAGPAVGTVVAPGPAVGTVVAPGPALGTIVAPAAGPAVGTVVAPGPAVPTTVAPSPYNSSYPPTAGGVVQGHATQPPQAVVASPPPYGAASTGAVVQGYATPPPQAVTPPPQVAEVVATAPMDRK